MACWNTFGISSGRFKIDSVTPVMKYHMLEGRCGYVLMDCSRGGVMMDGSIAEVMFHQLRDCTRFSSMRNPVFSLICVQRQQVPVFHFAIY